MDSRIPSPSSSFTSPSQSQELARPVDASSSPGSGRADSSGLSQESPSRESEGGDAPPSCAENADSERHPKGRRKRTAAKDKAILEAAYNANPKPDKAARLDIVRRVSLNEKEVQIWFQNRRQNDRRKSRPLSPQEIAALRYGGMQILSSDPVSFGGPENSGSSSSNNNDNGAGGLEEAPFHQSTTPIASPDLDPWLAERYPAYSPPRLDAAATPDAAARISMETPSQQPNQPADAYSSQPLSVSATSSANFASGRWRTAGGGSSFSTPSSSFMRHSGSGSSDDSFKLEPFLQSSSDPPSSSSSSAVPRILPPPQQQKREHSRSNSQVRISLSLEGKASLTSLSASPSPPRDSHASSSNNDTLNHTNLDPIPISIPSIRRPSLTRSQSAVTLPPISALTGSLCGSASSSSGSSSRRANSAAGPQAPAPAAAPPRLARHRSRDVHAWEFACDRIPRDGGEALQEQQLLLQAEDELSAQARHEASGSALAAISLLRTTTTTAAAAASSAVSSSATGTAGGSGAVLQPNAGKRNAPLHRSHSSVAGSAGAGGAAAGGPFKRAKLGRASSSVAKMQQSITNANAGGGVGLGPSASASASSLSLSLSRFNVERLVDPDYAAKTKAAAEDSSTKKKMELSALIVPSGNDSDKENWSPDEDGGPRQQQQQRQYRLPPPVPSARRTQQQQQQAHSSGLDGRRTITTLGEQNQLERQLFGGGGRSHTAPSGKGGIGIGSGSGTGSSSIEIFEDGGAADVELFMRGEVSPSKKPDMDCVAGLLSLSQGNWR